MRKIAKGFISALVSSVLCFSGIPIQSANAYIVIDHDCSGIDKGYYFEITNNDEDNQPEFWLASDGGFNCTWDSDKGFSAVRGLKFASPARYSSLGEINCKYWKRITADAFTDNKDGYIRFGIRLRNTKGDIFDILELEESADGSSITEKGGKLKQIGSLVSNEVFNDYFLGRQVEGDVYNVSYEVFESENEGQDGNHFICRRKNPLKINTDTEDSRRISISDKLDFIADTGYDPGEITDIDMFLECSHSNGQAYIRNDEIYIKRMPELAPDKYEDMEAPIIVKENEYGERNGYYYSISNCYSGENVEIISPSLFRAEWDSINSSYRVYPIFERGKQYENGQSYNAISGSSVEYTMDLDAYGDYFVSTYALMYGPDTYNNRMQTEISIVDACSKWTLPYSAQDKREVNIDGKVYDFYYCPHGMLGTGREIIINSYYFVDRDARANVASGTFTVKHDMKPFVDYIHDSGAVLGTPEKLVVQLNGRTSIGEAKLVKNIITIPDYVEDDKEFEKEKKKIDLGLKNAFTYVDNTYYEVRGHLSSMQGYGGDKVNCEWQVPGEFFDEDNTVHRINIGRRGLNITGDFDTYQGKAPMVIDYSMDMADITDKGDTSKWFFGGTINCINEEAYKTDSGELPQDMCVGCDIWVVDKWEGDLTTEFNGGTAEYLEPENIGVIETQGVKYDVEIAFPDKNMANGINSYNNSPIVILKRKEQLQPSEADDVPEGYKRYENSVDATDIVHKLSDMGIETYGIFDAYFTLRSIGNCGKAIINSASVSTVPTEETVYTIEDINKLKDYILGKDTSIPSGEDYDLNDDGVWDTYDLCEMRRRIGSINTTEYVKPDELIQYGSYLTVQADDLKLYIGPDESYGLITSIPKNTRLKELGIQHNNDEWFFTEYNGSYGWTKTFQDDNTTLTGIYDNYDFKPVIYLYPEQKTDVHVELELTESDLYTTYPKYNNGWDVTAYPDGNLTNKADGTHHKYLFWESSNCRTRYDFSKGFCVAGSDTESFLKEKLSYMGLTEDEMNEFIVYWLPLMEHNKYNLISFQGDTYTNSAKLDITPVPDSLLRIFMAYVPLDEAIDIEPQQLSIFERNGFTVVEWGGSRIQ